MAVNSTRLRRKASNHLLLQRARIPLRKGWECVKLQVNGLTCGYAGTGPSNLYEVLQAAGVSEAQVAREDITQKSTKTIPLRLERAVTQYGDFQFA